MRAITVSGAFRWILPTIRGAGFGWPERSSAVPGLSMSTPSSAVAKRGAIKSGTQLCEFATAQL
jgi:hypothetical protein